jgi:8-oxo-dGTP pyrophosphatase MutT (NUDIX family)
MTRQIIEPYREVAAAILVGRCGRLLLQQRDDIPGLLYAGLIGLFGGHREGIETPIETVRRELLEETGIAFEASRFETLVEFSAAYPLGGGIKGTYYVVREVPIEDAVVTEGSPLIVERDGLPALLPRMTPSACYAARLFMQLAA